MKNRRIPMKRTIYNNYDLSVYKEEAKEYLWENGNEEPTEEELLSECYILDADYWNNAKYDFDEFFDGSSWILQGYCGRWNGKAKGGKIFTGFKGFMETFGKATMDCDFIHIYDENGHLYIQCSHHDGTNLYEIKRVTEAGMKYLDRWEDDWNDKRTEEHVHDMIMRKYSRLPNFAHKVYGNKRIEFETEGNK